MTEFSDTAMPPAEDPRVGMMRMLHAPLVTQLVVVAAELGLADLVAERPRTVEDLAARLDVLPDPLYRVLRALASVGVFREVSSRTFGTTPLAGTLRQGAPGSMRAWARLWGVPQRTAAIGALLHSVRTGEPSFDHVHGRTWWEHLAANPEQGTVFSDAMGDLSRQLHAAAVETYDLSGVRRLVDIGGGKGYLVATILRRYPEMTAIVYDQPSTVAKAGPVLAEAGVADRVEVVGGDFFSSVPEGGDAYLLSMILHDWDDEQSTTILTNIRRAMDPDGRVLVIDAVLPEDDSPHDGKLRDIIMLALHPGRERTEAEFADLFERSGLRHKETNAVTGSTGLLVAVPE